MEKAGLEGKYQNILVVVLSIISYLCGGLVLITPYLFYQDDYQCPSLAVSECFTYVCSLPLEQRQPFVPSPTIYSLANEFGDFRCD